MQIPVLIDLDGLPASVEQHHQAQPDGHLDGADGHDDDAENLPGVVAGGGETPEREDVQPMALSSTSIPIKIMTAVRCTKMA